MPPRRARGAVATVFLVNGIVIASWVPLIPEIKARHGLGDAKLGLVLLAMAVGAVLSLPVAGWLVGHLGSRVMTSVAGLGLCLSLPLPVISPTVPWLAAALTLLGAFNGTLDVSMNAQAVAVETRYGRPIMSSFHGLFSLGGVVGAALAAAAMKVGVGHGWHIGAITAVCGALALHAVGGLLPSPQPSGRAGPVFSLPSADVLGLGLLAFSALLAEGAMADWGAVYLHDSLGATSAQAASGFAVFSLSMAAGRFGGDHLVRRIGPVATLRASSAVASVGLGTALLLQTPSAAIVGFGAVGLGIANAVPVLFSSAARARPSASGAALAAVATTGYVGFLAGPPLIGLTAEVTSLPVALGLVSAACGLMAVRAGWAAVTMAPSPPQARRIEARVLDS